jgi:hypothetical protein
MIVDLLDPMSRYRIMMTCRWLRDLMGVVMMKELIILDRHGSSRAKHLDDQQLRILRKFTRAGSGLITNNLSRLWRHESPSVVGPSTPTPIAQEFYDWFYPALPKMERLTSLVLGGMHTPQVAFERLLQRAADGEILRHLETRMWSISRRFGLVPYTDMNPSGLPSSQPGPAGHCRAGSPHHPLRHPASKVT